jgi:hypothetical protein
LAYRRCAKATRLIRTGSNEWSLPLRRRETPLQPGKQPHSRLANDRASPGIMTVSPSTAPQLAEGSVAFVEQKFGFKLPYTPESLILVDAIIDKIKETGATEQQASGLLSGLGCYVGEVFVRNAKASWRSTAEMGMRASCRFPAVLALPGPVGCDPIGRVFERFNSESTDGAARLYETTVPAARGGAGSRRP